MTDPLHYMTDCTLATVAHMAYLKTRPAGEFRRQIAIAQRGMDFLLEAATPLSSRPKEVAEKFKWRVDSWADDIIARKA